MQDLTGRTAFVTGGASGIGLAMARAFLGEGMNVAIADVRKDRLERAEQSLPKAAGGLIALEVDVTNKAALEAAADRTQERFGDLHILCNNAGISGGEFRGAPEDEAWRRVIEINLWGVLNGVQVFLPRMLAHGQQGCIVNTASFVGIHGYTNLSPYSVSKFAVVGLTENLRNDLRSRNISVSLLCPHIVDTPIFFPGVADTDVEATAKRRARMPTWYQTAVISADDVGRHVVACIKTGEFYIFCDGVHSRAMLKTRVGELMAAMDRQFPSVAEIGTQSSQHKDSERS
jgi:NAD(P)-dependent dehydrogenase (short-subunit alcohol dehydrogenase family)